MTYLASSYFDLLKIEVEIRSLSSDEQARLNALVFAKKLMLPTGLMRILTFFIRKNPVKMYMFMYNVCKRNEESNVRFTEQLIHHLVHGKDTEDQNSVGGFSQRELNILSICIQSGM